MLYLYSIYPSYQEANLGLICS